MAEAVGIAIGLAGLMTLYDSCIELAEQIELARNIGTDYEEAYTKLLSLKARLRECGRKRVFQNQPHAFPELDATYREEFNLAQRALVQIKRLLENADTFHGTYGDRPHDGRVGELSLTQPQSASFQHTEVALNQLSIQRQRSTSLRKKAQWAIRDKKAFDKLINNLDYLIRQLEFLVERVSNASESLREPGGPTPTASHKLLLTRSETAEIDISMTTATQTYQLPQESEVGGHIYKNNVI